MEYKDYYKVMGLAHDASPADIKKVYRKLARKYHPDVSKESNAEDQFKELQEAYAVLKDPEKRQAYDHLGSRWEAGQEFRPPPEWAETSQQEYQPDFSDFFSSLFGGAARHAPPRDFAMRGEDLRTQLEINLEDAYHGITPTIRLNVPSIDQNGRVTRQQKTLRVKIPAGVTVGQKIRLAGQGGEGTPNAPKGDLYLEIVIKPHPYFAVENRDLYLSLPITPWEAALGAKVKVPTLPGIVEMKVPAGTKTGQKMRLKGKGLKSKSILGDQYVVFQIQTPKPATDGQQKLYEAMAKEFPFNPRETLLQSFGAS